VTATPVITITPTLAPTPTPKSLESFEEDFTGYVEALDRLGVTEAELRYIVESQIFREKLLEVLTEDVQNVQDQVWARHILVASEAEALDVIARLEAGEDFASLATELSSDTASAANAGDLGWFGVGQMVQEFEKVAFNLQVGQISEPTQSQFGWHVIQVLGHEERPLTVTEFAELKQSVFEDWLSTERIRADVELFDIWAERVPTTPTFPAGGAQALLQQLQVPQP
jgi:parvulin-like peptidyl-prolyl isomerase